MLSGKGTKEMKMLAIGIDLENGLYGRNLLMLRKKGLVATKRFRGKRLLPL